MLKMLPMLMFMFSIPCAAQLPDAPKPHVDKVEWALLIADASVRGLDVYSTHQMLANGCDELILPDAISHHTAAMAAYSGATVVLDWFVARKLPRHRKLAH